MEEGQSFHQRVLESLDTHIQTNKNKIKNLDTDLYISQKLIQNQSHI